jgi:uncharacterized protein YlzI (FlbEa/FlbD family)
MKFAQLTSVHGYTQFINPIQVTSFHKAPTGTSVGLAGGTTIIVKEDAEAVLKALRDAAN